MHIVIQAARLGQRRVLIMGEDAELAARIGAVFERAGAVVQRVHCASSHHPDGTAPIGRAPDSSAAAHAAMRELGGLDVLVNIGPASLPGDSADPDRRSREVERALQRSMEHIVATTEAALGVMTAGGSIINVVGLSVRSLTAAHLALAAAVVDTTQDLAGILTERGIRANVVVGGPAVEPVVEGSLPAERNGQAAAVAAQFDALVYLASENSSYVSGSVISLTRKADPLRAESPAFGRGRSGLAD